MRSAVQESVESQSPAGLQSKPLAAKYLGGVSLKTLDRLVSRRDLPCVKILGRTMFRVADLDAYIERQAAKCSSRQSEASAKVGG